MSDAPSSGPTGHLGAATRGQSGKFQIGAGSKGGLGGSPATGVGGAHIEGPSSSSSQAIEEQGTTSTVQSGPEESSSSDRGISQKAIDRWKAETEGHHEGHFKRSGKAGFKPPRDQSPPWKPR